MIPRRKVLSAIKLTALTLLALIVCLAAVVPIQQRIFRWRAERLLADMQSIELHKTTWDQAQVLMHRWGKWGHYDGACTAENCKYTITLADIGTSGLPWHMFFASYIANLRIYRWLGGRSAVLYAGFIVQDGTIRRTFLSANMFIPPHIDSPNDEYGYALIVYVNNRSRLSDDRDGKTSHWILGDESELAEHPYYKVGRPGGCEICMEADVTYALDTPLDEVRRFTSFDLSCLTRWHYCMHVEDLLPALEPFHLYGNFPSPEPPRSPCGPPLWAVGRDAWSVIAIDALNVKTMDNSEYGEPRKDKIVTARFKEMLKGAAPWPQGAILTVYTDMGNSDSPVQMVAGKRYLALVQYSFWNGSAGGSLGFVHGLPGISLDSCDIVEDTPQNRQELQRGFAANDPLRIDDF